ncbi:MAG: RNA polymerase sigma factor [Opitutales bacterium]|nr:RNA polymerase sigma factor [Opitutales bacterium]
MNDTQDNLIMQAVKNGELSELSYLYSWYHLRLLGFFYKLSGDRDLSEDLVQETFWRILRYRKSYKSENSFKGWMFQVGRNLFYDQMNKNKPGRVVSMADVQFESASSGILPDESAEKNERSVLLKQAMDKLPEDKKEILILSRYEHLSYAEIGDILGCSEGAVKVRVFRAMEQLRIQFKALNEEAI